MRFDILTLFPEAFTSFVSTSIIGRAIEAGIIEVVLHDIRDFSTNKHRKVDDVPYGGGAGMLMTCQPLFDCIEHVKELKKDKAPVIFFTPSNNIFDQEMVEQFSKYDFEKIKNEKLKMKSFDSELELADTDSKPTATSEQRTTSKTNRYILLCGHYEGIDQRVRDRLVDIEISMGNYILTGGELPAQIFIDAVSRLLSGVLGDEESHQEESFSAKLGRDMIEYPHYTRPENFRGMKVPEVLMSGHHANIEQWKVDNKVKGC